MWSLWLRRQHVSERLPLRLYNTFVQPVLLYNAGTWGLTGSEIDKLNAFHRKQLRLLFGIKWPQRISNSNLYERCECREISTDVMDMRWRLFGRVLRLDEKAPANQAMSAYFETPELQGHRGRPRTKPPRSLDTDLQHIGMRLKTRADLEMLRRIALNRTGWRILHKTILGEAV